LSATIRAVSIHPEGTVTDHDLSDNGNQLGTLQSLVGGFIEGVAVSDTVAAFVNEEGKIEQLATNPVAEYVGRSMGMQIITGDYLVGTVVFTGAPDARGNIQALTDDDAASIRVRANAFAARFPKAVAADTTAHDSYDTDPCPCGFRPASNSNHRESCADAHRTAAAATGITRMRLFERATAENDYDMIRALRVTAEQPPSSPTQHCGEVHAASLERGELVDCVKVGRHWKHQNSEGSLQWWGHKLDDTELAEAERIRQLGGFDRAKFNAWVERLG